MKTGDLVTSLEEITFGVSSSTAERETIVRLDPVTDTWALWTADPTMAKRWFRRGYEVHVDGTVGGVARTWQVEGLRLGAVRFGPVAPSDARRAAAKRAAASRFNVPVDLRDDSASGEGEG